jgi:hypothetical protein
MSLLYVGLAGLGVGALGGYTMSSKIDNTLNIMLLGACVFIYIRK